MASSLSGRAVPEQYMNIEQMLTVVEPYQEDRKNLLLIWRHFFRLSYWYWWGLTGGNPTDEFSDEKMDKGPRIVTGAVTSKFKKNGEASSQFSEKWIWDDIERRPEWYILALEVDGAYNFYVDMMVHEKVTIEEIMDHIMGELGLDKISSELSIFGMDNNGRANVENPDGVLKLNLAHTSPVMQMPFKVVFERMEEITVKVSQIEFCGEPEDDDGEAFHNEWKLIERKVMRLTGGK